MNATDIAAALSYRAEELCRRYLPDGRTRQLLDHRQPQRRQGPLTLCLPCTSGPPWQMDRCEHRRTRRPPRHHPAPHPRPYLSRRPRCRSRLPRPPTSRAGTRTAPINRHPTTKRTDDNKTPTRVEAAHTLWAQCTPPPRHPRRGRLCCKPDEGARWSGRITCSP